jgi:hypothetical protein
MQTLPGSLFMTVVFTGLVICSCSAEDSSQSVDPDVAQTSQALVSHVAAVPYLTQLGGYTELYSGFSSGTHKNPPYTACTETQISVLGFHEGSCLNDEFRSSAVGVDLNSHTADYAQLWATTAGGSSCPVMGCSVDIELQAAKRAIPADQWARLAPGSAIGVTIVVAASVNMPQTIAIQEVSTTGGPSVDLLNWAVPADGEGHTFRWSLTTNPLTRLPWTQADVSLATHWILRNFTPVDAAHPGGLFIQSFTSYVWYTTTT